MSSPKLSVAGRRHALLLARARRLAAPRVAPVQVESIACLVCETGDELCALPLSRIARVAPFSRAARVPSHNPALIGVTGRAGLFYHVFDLGMLIGAGRGGDTGHLVMLRGAPPIALRVDTAMRVADMVKLSATDISHMQASHPAVTSFVRPMQQQLFGGRAISLINPDKLASEVSPERVEGV